MTTFLFEAEPITCVSIEAELGLKRGNISRLIIYPSGAVELETQVVLTAFQQAKLKEMLTARGLGLGKKQEI